MSSYPYTVSYDYEIITQIDFTQGLFPKMCRHISIDPLLNAICLFRFFFLSFLRWAKQWEAKTCTTHLSIVCIEEVCGTSRCWLCIGKKKTININLLDKSFSLFSSNMVWFIAIVWKCGISIKFKDFLLILSQMLGYITGRIQIKIYCSLYVSLYHNKYSVVNWISPRLKVNIRISNGIEAVL